MEYLGAWGTLINEKNLKSKISCQTSFKNVKIVNFRSPDSDQGLLTLLEKH